MKDINIIVGKDGRLQGWENGRWKYLGDSENIGLHLVDDRTHMRVTNCSGKAITIHWDNFRTSIANSCTVEDIPVSLNAIWSNRLLYLYAIIRMYWKEGLEVASSIAGILSALRTFGILIHRN